MRRKKMKARTLKRLKAAIRHWRRMRDGKRRRLMHHEKSVKILEQPIQYHCSLCLEFNWRRDCAGCPVNDAGHYGCQGTPYQMAFFHFQDSGPDSKAFREAAAREVEFLESLLPRGEEV